jgi:protease-4
MMRSIGQTIKNQYVVGIGIRPMTNRLTITYDTYTDDLKNPWFGFEAEPIDGIEIKAKFNRKRDFSIQAGVNLINYGVGSALNSSFKSDTKKRWAGYFRFDMEKRKTLISASEKFLEMTLNGSIADQRPGFSLLGSSVNHTTYEILNTINSAKDDNRVAGLILKLDQPNMSLALAQEIKSALDDFKKHGKKLIVYASGLENVSYYLACSGDEIITHPLTEVAIPGIAARTMLLKGSLDKLGIKADYEYVGKYKSAPEMVAADSISLANREVINSILDDYYQNITSTISNERKLTQKEVDSRINQGFFLTKEAKENNLIDNYCYEDELDSILRNKYKNLQKISATRYMRQKDYQYDWQAPPKITVIYATGDIMSGESGTDPIMGSITCGASTIAKSIRTARQDKNVKAIILRIDSPGGDGFASDLIWRELAITKKTKPIIVSMGPVAASGGYYIAMAGDKIFASPATLTGSIGAFSIKFVTQELYSKLGIKTETIKRGEHADAFSSDRSFTDDERKTLKRHIEDFYAQFIGKVAQYRNVSSEYIDSIGQGRVWTGNQAQNLHLIDSLGGLLDAINYAKTEANVKEVKMEFLPKSRRGFFNLAVNLVRTIIKL